MYFGLSVRDKSNNSILHKTLNTYILLTQLQIKKIANKKVY